MTQSEERHTEAEKRMANLELNNWEEMFVTDLREKRDSHGLSNLSPKQKQCLKSIAGF